MILDQTHVLLHHSVLETTFKGVEHTISTPDIPISQFRGIKYASVPARFRQSKLFTSYPAVVDATRYGPICPQMKQKSLEEDLIGLSESDIPRQVFEQDEFECLNLNITCPAGITHESRLPVMLWFHGGGNRGCGSSWVYDGGAFVRKSVRIGRPLIMVTFNFRLGLFGCAASPKIAEDNKAAGDEGVGNYGLRDQRKALEWVNNFIGGFGGDPSNVTLFGESTGAADILSHLYSSVNQTKPLFARTIVQSALVEYDVPTVHNAGWQLSRLLSSLRITLVDQLRAVDPEVLLEVECPLRATDDGVFFRKGWKESIMPEEPSRLHPCTGTGLIEKTLSPFLMPMKKTGIKSRSPHPLSRGPTHVPVRHIASSPGLQPIIIGDCACDSFLWSLPASLWSASGVVRRLRAVCQSLTKATALLNAYDIAAHTPATELVDRVLELVNDARIAWPTECAAQAAKRARGGRGVWRYVFDQEGPVRGVPHHAVDLIYLFDNVPLPLSQQPSPMSFYDEPLPSSRTSPSPSSSDPSGRWTRTLNDLECMNVDDFENSRGWQGSEWTTPVVDEWSYAHVRDTMQERWIAFAHGEAPWDEDKVFVFGPEGESGERSACIFEGRRRCRLWKEALEPLGIQLVQKVGQELSNGPSLTSSKSLF
ncbi:hypothetical protein SERLA73DRAFT_101623 [Serpula lacrymans var. lacrymans S7.3]|uniref:Carboxylic ester hydrolase n=2 Tax=Serpula lacrymans var. lacrymans TaxID=341189 RepID=F8PJQ3_SERL3|nr:uncharacterized protein SERLADRAFT_445055 [Serpula lacrymans var. lacrymans S7.9]EGO03463.1 hypothetical protein SERLA73DRAFT_101623 [Serpula lacrymans var. lacrymans S7.3]EGO29223.1 hypothetical protein SERLADRAFT_445055 [Serpula lacrymans var. lacrymans S7.9]